jgi:hypothetical protein
MILMFKRLFEIKMVTREEIFDGTNFMWIDNDGGQSNIIFSDDGTIIFNRVRKDGVETFFETEISNVRKMFYDLVYSFDIKKININELNIDKINKFEIPDKDDENTILNITIEFLNTDDIDFYKKQIKTLFSR